MRYHLKRLANKLVGNLLRKFCFNSTYDEKLYTKPFLYIHTLISNKNYLTGQVADLERENEKMKHKDYFGKIKILMNTSIEELRELSKELFEDEEMGGNDQVSKEEDGSWSAIESFCMYDGHYVYANFKTERDALIAAILTEQLDWEMPSVICKECYNAYFV